jgi:hypothetical protein
MEINLGENMIEVFIENEEMEKKSETGRHLACKQDLVVRPSKETAPPGSVWALVVNSASPSVQVLIYPKNLPCRRTEIFMNQSATTTMIFIFGG